LNPATEGRAGRVVLLQDSRITKEDHDASCFYWMPLTGLGPHFDNAPLNAAVRLLDEKGETVETHELDHPLARIDVWKLYVDGRPTYAVTENDSICAGSWRGDVTTLMEVRDGHLVELRAAAPASKYDDLMAFNLGTRGAVRVVPARSGAGKDILYVRSGFGVSEKPGEPAFQTRLVRFAFENGRWTKHEKAIPGDYRFDSENPGFPARKDFD
jgi:hypothetical protein